MAKTTQYKRLDPELMKEITDFVIECHREEEARQVKIRHDRKRGNIKLLLRKYREIVEHVEETVYEASQVEEDLSLQDLLEMMSESRRETFRVESLRESAAKARVLVDHMNRMLESYREWCERSQKDEDKRRYRILFNMYISPETKTADEIAQTEYVDKSTVYRDIDAAADRLAVLFFGVYGLRFL